MNWEKALDHCQEENRFGLLKIRNQDFQLAVEAELKRRRVHEPVWVGLKQSILFEFWLWTDGSDVSPYTNWYQDAEHYNDCGTIDPHIKFKWRDRDCESKFRVLCQI